LQNDTHLSAFVKEAPTAFGFPIGAGNDSRNAFINQGSGSTSFNLFGIGSTQTLTGYDVNFLGASKASSSSITIRRASATSTITGTSVTPIGDGTVLVFARRTAGGGGGPSNYHNGRIAFYSLGKSLDLALLDSRVDTLISSIASAIP